MDGHYAPLRPDRYARYAPLRPAMPRYGRVATPAAPRYVPISVPRVQTRFAQLITPLDIDGIGQNWKDSNSVGTTIPRPPPHHS